MEDPEKVLDQAVDEMQADLVRVRQSYAQVLATQRRAVEQQRVQEEIAQSWYERATLAVEKGSDDLAKEALARRQAALSKAGDLTQQLQGMEDNVDRLFEAVQALESKITGAKDQKEQLVARARTARSTTQVNDMLSEVGQTGGVGAFNRMKEKVEIMEAQADVSQGLLPGASPNGDLEEQFKQLESGDIVDDELSRLKGLLTLPPGSAVEPADVAEAAGSEGAAALQQELEAMRRKLKETDD